MPIESTAISTPTIFLYGDLFKFSGPTTQNNNGTIVPVPAAGTNMFILRQHFRNDDTPMHDVIPLMSICEIVQLVPVFGAKMDTQFNSNTSLDLAQEFYLNNFANKNTFHAILSYQ